MLRVFVAVIIARQMLELAIDLGCPPPFCTIYQRLWYTDAVVQALQQLIRRLIGRTPYPLALQSLISLVLLATLPSALVENGYLLSAHFALLCALVGLALAVCWLVPVRTLSVWLQLAYLGLQAVATALAYMI